MINKKVILLVFTFIRLRKKGVPLHSTDSISQGALISMVVLGGLVFWDANKVVLCYVFDKLLPSLYQNHVKEKLIVVKI